MQDGEPAGSFCVFLAFNSSFLSGSLWFSAVTFAEITIYSKSCAELYSVENSFMVENLCDADHCIGNRGEMLTGDFTYIQRCLSYVSASSIRHSVVTAPAWSSQRRVDGGGFVFNRRFTFNSCRPKMCADALLHCKCGLLVMEGRREREIQLLGEFRKLVEIKVQ